jgi:hypothetical protein
VLIWLVVDAEEDKVDVRLSVAIVDVSGTDRGGFLHER